MRKLLEIYKQLSPLQRSLVSAVIGFAVYGSWAVLVNFMHGEERAIMAGLTQGAYSFALTFVMTLILESSYKRSFNALGSANLAITLTVILSCSVVFSGSWLVNYLAGTPEIFKTVILGYVIGGIYSLTYTIGLAREQGD